MKHYQTLLITLICTVSVLGVACEPQEPIRVYVTPTPQTEGATTTLIPTIVLPTATGEPTPVAQQATTVPPTATARPLTNAPTVTFIGPVVGESYTLPPTSTPRSTATPTPTVEVSPSATETAQATVLSPTLTPGGPVPTQLPMPDLDAARMGVQLDPTLNQNDWNQAIADLQRLGVKWLKVQLSWSQLQPNGPDEISEDLKRLEIYLKSAHNNGSGFNILLSIAKAPTWARSNRDQDGPPDDPNALARFITLVLDRIGIATYAVEIWDEPNLLREWVGQPLNGQSYMQYFAPAYDAIKAWSAAKANDPNEPLRHTIQIITAGLAPTGENPAGGSRNDRTYLQEMYAAGLARYTDVAVGIHPYGWWHPPTATCCSDDPRGWNNDPHFFFGDNIRDFRQVMESAGHGAAQLWITEVGYATWEYLPGDPPQTWMAYINECQQGNYTVEAFQFVQAQPYMGPMMLWNLNWAMLSGMVENRDERAAYSMIVPLPIRERAVYWMLYDAIRPAEQLPDYARCGGANVSR
jgi:hypothetical protein